jgi:acyl-CoA synthetase (AMP-forming)/AMP-acid ligase II
MYLTQTIRSNARNKPLGIATIQGDRKRTWNEFVERVSRLGAGLTSLGVSKGDRVAILALNSDRYFEYYFGCWWIGAVAVPMNLRWSALENAHSLNDSGAETLFIDDQYLAMAEDILKDSPGVKTKIHLGDSSTPNGFESYENLIATNEPIDDAGAGGEDLAGIFYTGGTTGFPKGVMLPHRGLWASGTALVAKRNLGSDAVYLHAAPMFHIADGAYSMGIAVCGGTHAFIPGFTPAATSDAIHDFSVTDVLLVPTMVRMILDDPNFDNAKFSSLRNIAYGASPMPEGVIRKALELLPNVEWTQAYGQSELSPIATLCGPEWHNFDDGNNGRIRSAGQAAICNELKIATEDGTELPRGEVGEVWVRGGNTMLGYWKRPEETERTLVNGWVRTGDAAWMDDEGFVFIADRLKDMIISGGENIYSTEVENALSKLEGIAEVAVIGIPSEKWGETVHAIIVPGQGVELKEHQVIDHCRDMIAHYKCPSSVEFRSEPLPLSGAGKVLKKDLRAPFWENQDLQVG